MDKDFIIKDLYLPSFWKLLRIERQKHQKEYRPTRGQDTDSKFEPQVSNTWASSYSWKDTSNTLLIYTKEELWYDSEWLSYYNSKL